MPSPDCSPKMDVVQALLRAFKRMESAQREDTTTRKYRMEHGPRLLRFVTYRGR